MFCTKCGAQNADGAGFCSSCGAPLQPSQAGNNSQGGDQEKKIVIKSPSYGRTGLVLSIFSMVCVAISPVGLLFGPPGMLLTGAAVIILALLAIVLGRKAMKELDRKYRDIAMQNIIYRDEYNRARHDVKFAVMSGSASIVAYIFLLLIILWAGSDLLW